MNEHDLQEPVISPLVKALTVSPMIFGVPYLYFMVIGVVTAVIFLIGKNLLLLFSCLPLYAIGRIATVKDQRIFEIIMIRASKCPPRSRAFWGADSYAP